MARSRDFITPRLWGVPWFEKPPLLYWITAVGSVCGLGPELAGRLPVALLSLGFLATAFVLLRREFGFESAALSVGLLATSAGWVAFSGLALTDLPMAVFFSIAVFLVLPVLRPTPDLSRLHWRFAAIGVSLGLAALGKGLVPLALALPMLWFLTRFWRLWWIPALAFVLIAGPWYVAVSLRYGYPFIAEFFIRHHLERLYSPSLQHVQPWYYFFPVALAGLLPWTPLFFLLLRSRRPPMDSRQQLLFATFCFGFLLFSVSLNKLPGYLLPLFPHAFAVLGARLHGRQLAEISRAWLAPCALCIAAFPLAASILPGTLAAGRLSLASFQWPTKTEWFYIAIPLAIVFVARRSWAVPLLILSLVASGLYVKATAYPTLEREVSARGLWRELSGVSAKLCDSGMNRDWIYGLSFYRDAFLTPCQPGEAKLHLHARDGGRPAIVPCEGKTGQRSSRLR